MKNQITYVVDFFDFGKWAKFSKSGMYLAFQEAGVPLVLVYQIWPSLVLVPILPNLVPKFYQIYQFFRTKIQDASKEP